MADLSGELSSPMPRRDTNFYYSFVALTAEKREAIVAVWDFFRAVDDAVDEAEPRPAEEVTPGVTSKSHSRSDFPAAAEAHARISLWRRELAACYGDGVPETPQGKALVSHIRRFSLPRQGFEDVIDGVEMDVTARRWDTFGSLHQYCLRVASAVGLVCIEIFGYRNAGCRQYAIDLGIALQLTNILRDLGKDSRCGRLYLPQEDLARFGVTETDLRAGAMTTGVRALLEFQASRAWEYFAKAGREMPREDAKNLVAARIMSAIYQSLLRRIELRGFDVFGEPICLPRWKKALVALRTWGATMAGF